MSADNTAHHGALSPVRPSLHTVFSLTSRATEKGRNGDSAWPLWGMAMRLLQAVWDRSDDRAEARWACTGMVPNGT